MFFPNKVTILQQGCASSAYVQLTLPLSTGTGMLLAGLYSLQILLPMLLLKKKFNFTAAEALLSSIALVHGVWALATRYLALCCTC